MNATRLIALARETIRSDDDMYPNTSNTLEAVLDELEAIVCRYEPAIWDIRDIVAFALVGKRPETPEKPTP